MKSAHRYGHLSDWILYAAPLSSVLAGSPDPRPNNELKLSPKRRLRRPGEALYPPWESTERHSQGGAGQASGLLATPERTSGA